MELDASRRGFSWWVFLKIPIRAGFGRRDTKAAAIFPVLLNPR